MTSSPMRDPTYFVLAALLAGPLHGYAIIKRAGELSGGRVRLATGTLYTALDRLTAEGHVEQAAAVVIAPGTVAPKTKARPLARKPRTA